MSPPAKRASTPQARGAKVVAAVLEAALEELSHVGLSGLSLEAVARRAGVNRTTIFRRWPTKSDLVLAALATQVESLFVDPDTGDVVEDLVVLARRVDALVRSERGKSLYLATLEDPAIAVPRRTSGLPDEEGVVPRAIIRRAVTRRQLPAGVDEQLLLRALFGGVVQPALRREPIARGHLRRHVRLVLAGAAALATEARPAPQRGRSLVTSRRPSADASPPSVRRGHVR